MKSRLFAAATSITALVVLLFLAPFTAQAQDTTIKTKQQAELLIPRPALQPVKSLDPNAAETLDTLDTANPHIKILLLSDYSWKYYKDAEYGKDIAEFNEYWNNDQPDPYHVPLDALQDEIALWIVDSLCGYRCPYQGEVYSKFGYRHGRRHQGVDLPFKTGTPVYAAFDGKVRMAKYFRGYGNLVVIRHENGLETFYGHLSKILVEVGDWINAGTMIGLGGSTGRSTGPHLHFETRYKGYAFDPEWLIDFSSGTLRHRLFVLKKKHFNADSKYVPEDEQVEIDILEGDTRDREEAAAKAEAERKALAAAQYHTIRSGDTLGALAIRYGTSVNKLCNLNGISSRTLLQIGRKLRVK
jgi:murein DD-endopeptidase MepM/ murein hydrolase activator NlpD